MSNMVDVKNAKKRFDDHAGQHGCQPALIVDQRGEGEKCNIRRVLWLEYMSMAEQWRDHDDAGDEQAYR